MRKLSYKWPLYVTALAFAMPGFYVFFRIGKPEIFRLNELAMKVVGALFFAIIAWLIYGVTCLLARSRTVAIEGQRVPINCGNCTFSEKVPRTSMDGIQDPEEMKCNLTGYNYTTDYICKKWKPKQAVAGESLLQKDKDDSVVKSASNAEQVDNNNHKKLASPISIFVEKELDKKVHHKNNKEETVGTQAQNEKNMYVEKPPPKTKSEPVVLGLLEKCANCDTIIGKLEKSYVFEDKTVCTYCYKKLNNQE